MRLTTIILAITLLVPAIAHADRWHRWHRWHHWNRWHQWVEGDAPDAAFGAIAFSDSTGRYGTSSGHESAEGAEAAAIAACGVGDCTWRAMERDQFAVLARGVGGVAAAWNPSYWVAAQAAVAACSAKGPGCHVIAWARD